MLSLVKMFDVDHDPKNLDHFMVDAGGGMVFKAYWAPWINRIHFIVLGSAHVLREHRLKALRRKSFNIRHNKSGSVCTIFNIVH